MAIPVFVWLSACTKKENPAPPPEPPVLKLVSMRFHNLPGPNYVLTTLTPSVVYNFSQPVSKSSLADALSLTDDAGTVIGFNSRWERGDSTVVITPVTGALKGLTNHRMSLRRSLKSLSGASLQSEFAFSFLTGIDSTPKFPAITNDSLLTLVQRQTFQYFWNFGHPVSGMARERNTSGDLVTTGGTGFGIMSMVAAIHNGFITRQQGLERLETMVQFLGTKAQRFRGAFPHWMNGITGNVIPYSANDDGADLVETSFLAMGLITARQYFSSSDARESELRLRINQIINGIEWNWFRKNNEQVLYWHWSPTHGWAINLKVTGWNECLITYVMAASSASHGISDTVYKRGFARDGAMVNGKSFYGTTLPLGEDRGGPLFYAHYSFLGIDPRGLRDQFADYWQQNLSHSRINFEHCKLNPNNWPGYSASCWGLTASDIPNGYTASSPLNDRGVIAPTAAVASLPYTPTQSMEAIRFFYYTLGDKLWKEYGFVDAFALGQAWFANSFLAIDQGPQIVMIENHKSGLLWNLFTSAPEVKAALRKLGFSAPYL